LEELINQPPKIQTCWG